MKDFRSFADLASRSFAGGAFIGLAGLVSLAVPGMLGSALFAFGLIFILVFQQSLYTGKIGFFKSLREIPDFATILIFNFLGVCLISQSINFFWPDLVERAVEITNRKTAADISYWVFFIKACYCGVLMYCAVMYYRLVGRETGVALCVFLFIVCGFEHCIADMFYFTFAGRLCLPHLLVAIAGNSVGSIVFKRITDAFPPKIVSENAASASTNDDKNNAA